MQEWIHLRIITMIHLPYNINWTGSSGILRYPGRINTSIGDPAKQKVKMSLLFFSINKPSFLTDGWHLLKAIMLAFIFLSSVVWIPVNWWKKLLIFFGFAVLWSVVFEIVYK